MPLFTRYTLVHDSSASLIEVGKRQSLSYVPGREDKCGRETLVEQEFHAQGTRIFEEKGDVDYLNSKTGMVAL